MRTALILGMLLCAGLSAQPAAGGAQEAEEHLAKARELLRQNRPDLAIAEFRALVALEPDNADARANLGVLLFFQGDDSAAAPELREAIRLDPRRAKIQALLGLSEKRMGQAAEARQDLEHAFPGLQEEKLRVQVGMELTEIEYAAGDLDQAADVIAQLRKLRPTDPDVLYTAQRIYSDLAEETRLSLAMAAPDSARLHQAIADLAARRGNFAAAIAHYREALRLQPRLPGLRFQLAEALRASSSPADQAAAEPEYARALADNPRDVRSLCRLAESALARSDGKQAQARYRQALALAPGDAAANLGMARVLMESSQSAQALPFLLRAAAADPADPVVHMRLATVYRESGRSADAARELAEFRKLKDLKERLENVHEKTRLPGEDRGRQDIPEK